MENLVIRSAIVQSNNNSRGGNKPELMTSSKVTKEMVSERIKFTHSLISAAKGDKVIMVLCMILNLFSADRADLEDRESVARAGRHYDQLLQAYLRSKYSFYESRIIYPQLLITLGGVHRYGEQSSQQIVTLSDLESLIKDMFSPS